MKKTLIACSFAVFACSAFAGSTASLCNQFTPEQDGIRCRVSDIDGLGSTLLVRIHTRKDDAPAKIEKAKLLTRLAIDSFLAEGGVFIKMRTTRADGLEVERTCSKIKGKKTEHCGDWAPAT